MKRNRSNSTSLNADNKIVIGYIGEMYSFTYLAANFKSSLDKLIDNTLHYAVLPLESSYNGTILGVYDKLLLSQNNLKIVAEIGVLEDHYLCTPKDMDASATAISKVYCHPHILECCSEYLNSLDLQRIKNNLPVIARVTHWDSADACSVVTNMAAEHSTDTVAAICSKDAALHHKMNIVAHGIGNEKNIQTRYVIVAGKDNKNHHLRDPLKLAPSRSHQQLSTTKGTPLKASIAVAVKNSPGAIYKITSCFALRDVNITKIDSRPASVAAEMAITNNNNNKRKKRTTINNSDSVFIHWDLIFYIDYMPSDDDEVNQALMANVEEFSIWVRDLGCYTTGVQRVELLPSQWNQIIDTLGY